MFIVEENMSGVDRQDPPLAALGLACQYSTGAETPFNEPYITRKYYRSSTVWSCPLPPSDAAALPARVRVSGVDEGAVHMGDGWFDLVQRDQLGARVDEGPAGDELVLRLGPLYNQGGETRISEDIAYYVAHYTAKGVDRFLMYTEDDENAADLTAAFPQVTVVQMRGEGRRNPSS